MIKIINKINFHAFDFSNFHIEFKKISSWNIIIFAKSTSGFKCYQKFYLKKKKLKEWQELEDYSIQYVNFKKYSEIIFN